MVMVSKCRERRFRMRYFVAGIAGVAGMFQVRERSGGVLVWWLVL